MKQVDTFFNHPAGNFDDMGASFSWKIPANFNLAEAVCGRHKRASKQVALFCENDQGESARYTFGDLEKLSNRLANLLISLGLKRGDRVAILLPQRVETGIAHLAAWKVGALSLPLSILFGSEALRYRLEDSGARFMITTKEASEALQPLTPDLPNLKTIINCDDSVSGFWTLIDKASDQFSPVLTQANDPALVIYTSGTTGPPKGAVLAHRCLLGNLTGFELSQNFFPQPDDLMWTPADWAWTGGLLDGLMPSWFYGRPVLGFDGGKFDPERACHLVNNYQVKNAFIPPTALKMFRQVSDKLIKSLDLRSIMSAGESMGAHIYQWAEEELGVKVNEMWGQTEFNYLVGNCSAVMRVKPGAMGKPYPGHRVEPVDEQGNVLADGEIGELCAWRDDPVMFLGYWNREQATRDKFIGPWWSTGDLGYRDSDGYLWFMGRKDDVISSAGHRTGPGEIEDCLLKNPAVSQAAVVGIPDELRGEIIKAFVVLAPGHQSSETLKKEMQSQVRRERSEYEYPREIEFLEQLPMTTTGKIRRVELREREQKRRQSLVDQS
ncbi:AMP-binding protein [Arenicellales bacterium IMCC57338]